ncbi:MAG: conjugative transposon protein TraN [Prolixibacteraceae bacterium]|nr:conjugative transposon protein TraN [Prolixibacteraceae bacterium]
MKTKVFNFIITLVCLFLFASANAQQKTKPDLPSFHIQKDVAIHFVSPEPIQFVDISTNWIVGDIPVDNVLRIKYVDLESKTISDSAAAIITIIGQSFIAQYKMIYNPAPKSVCSHIEVLPEHMNPLEFPKITMSFQKMKDFATQILYKEPNFKNVTNKNLGMTANLNNIFALGDYIFLDLSFKNSTNIKYDIDQVRFKIRDKKITKATNVQDVEVKPTFTLYKNQSFKKSYRNIFVFPKLTFPGNKTFTIQLTEKQISGRVVELDIDYSDLLQADTL